MKERLHFSDMLFIVAGERDRQKKQRGENHITAYTTLQVYLSISFTYETKPVVVHKQTANVAHRKVRSSFNRMHAWRGLLP